MDAKTEEVQVQNSSQEAQQPLADKQAYDPDLAAYTARTSLDDIRAKLEEYRKESIDAQSLIDAIPDPVALLEENRQIIATNDAMKKHLQSLGIQAEIGLRPGEALRCIHASECQTGCGTSRSCKGCPAFRSILSAQCGSRHSSVCDFTITTPRGADHLSTAVTASPLNVSGHNYTFMSLRDIGREVKRHRIDRAFFHDVLNTAWIISGYSNLLMASPETSDNAYVKRINYSSSKIIEEIEHQRDLANAQAGELHVKYEDINLKDMIHQMAEEYKADINNRVWLLVSPDVAADVSVHNSPSLLKRVLFSLLKSISESSEKEDLVEFGFDVYNDNIVLWFQNRDLELTQEEVQQFLNTYSTRAYRNLSTYTLEILTVPFVKGKIGVEAEKGKGSRFTLRIPLNVNIDSNN